MNDDYTTDGRGFDEDGDLVEVENARQTVAGDSPVLGVTTENGVVLASYEAPSSSLAVTDSQNNPRSLETVGIAFAGNEADAASLIEEAFQTTRDEHVKFGEPASGQLVTETIASRIGEATQDFEQRPFASAFLVSDGTDNSLRVVGVDGTVRQWRARAVGQRSSQLNQYLEDHYESEGLYTDDAVAMVLDGLNRVLGGIDLDGVSVLVVTEEGHSTVSESRLEELR